MTCPGKGGPRPASGTGRDDKAHKDGLGGGEVVPSAGGQPKEARARARLATCCAAEAKLSYLSLTFIVWGNRNSPHEDDCREGRRLQQHMCYKELTRVPGAREAFLIRDSYCLLLILL